MAAGGPFQSVNCRCRKWLPEVGMLSPTDPVFVGYKISPKRISGMLIVSRQLLRQQTGPELDRILINDLSRQLASYLDQCAIYGGGLINVPWVPQNVAIDLANLHPSFCAVEEQIETANVSMDCYGVIVSPGTRKILRTTPSFHGRLNHDLGRTSQPAKFAGSHRRKSVRRMLEQHNVLHLGSRRRTLD